MILVTGANGLVGSYFCRYLLQQGKKVRGMKRSSSDMRLVADIQKQIEWVDADVLDISSIEDAMSNVDQVIHCAAVISYLHKNRTLLHQVNVEGTANIVNVALDLQIKKMVYVSSIAALGRTGKNPEYVTEETPWERKYLSSDYSVSKFLAEREVWRGIGEGLNAVIVNPSIIIGSGNWDQGSCKLFSTVQKGFRYYTEGITGYVDVRDVVRIATALLESDIQEERFILCSDNISYREMMLSIAKYLHVKGPSVKAGKFLSSIAWRSEWMKSLISGSEPSVTKQTAAIANRQAFFDASKIKKLGFDFIPVQRSLSDTAIAFQNEMQTGKFSALKF